jgi:hypothetical protein
VQKERIDQFDIFKIFKERELLDGFNQYFIGCILLM